MLRRADSCRTRARPSLELPVLPSWVVDFSLGRTDFHEFAAIWRSDQSLEAAQNRDLAATTTFFMQFSLWIDDRLALQEILEDVGSKFVPHPDRAFYCFGGLVLTSFLVQVATGFALTFYYRPSVSEALASVRSIMIDVHSGWLIRSGHRWGASLMVCCIVLHVCRVYLTGGFKKPREVTWITGVALAVCTVSFGVTGYSLPYDQVGYWALRIVSGVPDCIPVVGQVLVELIRGGPSVGQATLTRFYSLHTFVLPLVTLALMLVHFLLIRKQGISGPL